MKKVTTAIIGTGFMGRVHIEGIRRLGHVEVVAVAGSSDASAKKFAAEMGVERSTGDYKTLLADPSIDAVHVLTPNSLHFPMSMAALEAGKAVLCEKPLTVTSAEAKKMVALAAKKNLPNAVCHNLRTRRNPPCPGHLLPGLAPLRNRFQLAHRGRPQRRTPRHGRHRIPLDGHDPAPHRAAHH